MSENYDQLEALLRGLRPAAPDPEMQERVGADLKLDEAWLPRQVRRAPRWLVATGWAGLGAAAAVVALTILTGEEPRDGGLRNGGVAEAAVSVERKEPMLPVRVWSVERRAWIDPADGAEIIVEIPKAQEGKVVLPVNFQ